MTRVRIPPHRTPPPVPNRTVEHNSRALPSQPLGTLRTRWTVYAVQGTEPVTTIKLNCWRATFYFFPFDKITIDGIEVSEALNPEGVGYDIVQIPVGGAMYKGIPVYLNEVHTLRSPSGNDRRVLVVEEFFDPATNPNN